jgi:hypothetical protein
VKQIDDDTHIWVGQQRHRLGNARFLFAIADNHGALLPFGTTEHAWLHSACWASWHRARKSEALAALIAVGIPIPFRRKDRPPCDAKEILLKRSDGAWWKRSISSGRADSAPLPGPGNRLVPLTRVAMRLAIAYSTVRMGPIRESSPLMPLPARSPALACYLTWRSDCWALDRMDGRGCGTAPPPVRRSLPTSPDPLYSLSASWGYRPVRPDLQCTPNGANFRRNLNSLL